MAFSLGIFHNTPVFASAASYLTAHHFAYLEKAALISVPSSAKDALEFAADPSALKGFLSLQEPSAVKYFFEIPSASNPDRLPLSTDPNGPRRDHDLATDQLEIFTSHLIRGATELTGEATSWQEVAALEMKYAALFSAESSDHELPAARKLGVNFGQVGMKRKALSIFLNEVLTSDAFRPTAPDQLETSLSRIELIIQVMGDMLEAGLPEHAAKMFDQASTFLDEVMTHVEARQLNAAKKREIWYELKHLIQNLPDGVKKDTLDSKLLQLV